MGRFEGKVAIVTGAGSGIGKATAVQFGAEGASVACLDVTGAQDSVAADISSAGPGKAVGISCDVSNEDAVKAAVSEVVSRLGSPSIVCNIAGIGKFSHTTDVELADWNRIVGVNLTGPFLMCRLNCWNHGPAL